MSLATRMLIAEKYGLLLDFNAIAQLLGKEPRTVQKDFHAGNLGIPMTKHGARWLAHYEDVADYVDTFKSGASRASPGPAAYSA